MEQSSNTQQYGLPDYTRGEERFNTCSHLLGALLSPVVLVFCLQRAKTPAAIAGSWIYGLSMLAVYTVSALYHSTRPGQTKKRLQILDHCTIYMLIAGTYTPILLTRFLPVYPAIGAGMLVFQWGLSAVAIIQTAADMQRHRVFSMVCYILLGWSIAFFFPQAWQVLTPAGFGWLLTGGIAYTVGAILFGIGKKVRWMHSIFHLFVLLGTALQFAAIYGCCI